MISHITMYMKRFNETESTIFALLSILISRYTSSVQHHSETHYSFSCVQASDRRFVFSWCNSYDTN